MLGDLLHSLGSAVGALEAQISGLGDPAARRPREVAFYDPESGDVHDLEDDTRETAGSALAVAGSAWLLSRLLRPKPVSWPRVVLAGIAATSLADLIGRTAEEEPAPGQEPYASDGEQLLARFGAGVATAAGYAAILYPRIPGPPLLRGLVFGSLELLAAPRGGLAGLAQGAPGVKFPLQALALPVDEDAGPLSHLAFGVGLGLFYRYGRDGDEDE